MVQSLSRLSRLETFGSPTFNFNVGSISANSSVLVDLETATPVSRKAGDCSKYLPLDSLTVINNSSSLIQVQANEHIFVVAPSVTTTKTRIAYSDVKITELSGSSISTKTVYLNCWREAVTEDISLQRKLGGRLKRGLW